MTEHDTPSTALVRMAYGDARCTDMNDPAHANGCPQDAEFDRWLAAQLELKRAEVLAQVREGLETLQLEDDDDAPVSEAEAAFDAAYEDVRRLALAVVDRLEGKQ